MADSCRPVSRHGRYNATGPSSVPYGTDIASYGNVDYTPSNEMYTVNQPDRPERPKTGRGRRRRADIPPRPSSRRSRGRETGIAPDNEGYGRPASRVGFSPESSYRYSHDEYSRQIVPESRNVNSPSSSPDEGIYRATQPQDFYGAHQQDNLGQSPGSGQVDRLLISPSNPQEEIFRRSPQGVKNSPQRYNHSPKGYRQSPSYETQFARPSSRPSSRDFINVSPIQRDEPQIRDDDLHHDHAPLYPPGGDPYAHEGNAYLQGFSESPHHQNSPYRDSPPIRNSPYQESPQFRDSPYNSGNSPTNRYSYGGSPQSYTRPPPSQRPKSARPRTGRKKSARARHRHEEQETSQPQMCNTESILHTGDPYGRPSSSLSRYKPLPAIGMMTPRGVANTGTSQNSPDPIQNNVTEITNQTDSLVLGDQMQFHPADDNEDPVCAEDIQGASAQMSGPLTDTGIPGVNTLTNFPQHLTNEIYSQSVLNFEQNIEGQADSGRIDINDESWIKPNSEMQQSPKRQEPLDILHKLPNEPAEGESRILLAIKLPDGKRIQRYFCPRDQLKCVVDFAENSNLEKYRNYHLVCMAPRTTFEDLSISIEEASLKDRTVLYLEEKDL